MIYQPSEDSFLLAEQVKKYAKGRKVLDVGSGLGIQAETALKAKARRVLAVDVDNNVVKHLRKKGINAKKSDLFSNVKGKFDLIVFNPPYLPFDEREDKESSFSTAGGKKGDEIILRFLRKVKKNLDKNGIILVVLSSLTPRNKIEKVLRKQKLKKKILAEEKFFMERIEVWKIEKA